MNLVQLPQPCAAQALPVEDEEVRSIPPPSNPTLSEQLAQTQASASW